MQVDYKKLASGFGFKTEASARVSWNGVKKKIDKLAASIGKGGEEGEGMQWVCVRARSIGTDGFAGDEDAAAEDGDDAAAEPKGKPKANKSAKRKAPVKAEADDDEEAEAEAPKSPVKKARKAPAKKGKAVAEEDGEQTVDGEEGKGAKKGRPAKAKKGKAAVTDDEGVAEE